ncbi:MAG: hypothetical protein R3208_20965 [Ketobacteraceae bacterium]|nr:hypothetical protein [Ketobacteraceae bacterium]
MANDEKTQHQDTTDKPADKPAESTDSPPIENSPQPGRQQQSSQRKGSSFGLGFLFGIALSLLIAAYPLYQAFFSQQDQEKVVSQAILDTMQMQITLAHKELDSVNRQLEMIAEAEARYQELVDQRFDLETSRTHLLERIEKLEAELLRAETELGIEANKFDRITESMRLE